MKSTSQLVFGLGLILDCRQLSSISFCGIYKSSISLKKINNLLSAKIIELFIINKLIVVTNYVIKLTIGIISSIIISSFWLTVHNLFS